MWQNMEKTLSVLLVEDEPDECDAFVQYIDTLEDVRLVQTTNNADKALEYARDYLPDVIILDLELHKGKGNGIAFLAALNQACLTVTPYILVTTNNISDMTHMQVRRLGADFIMVKSQSDYSVKSVIEFLQALKDSIHNLRKKKMDSNGLDEAPPAEMERRLLTRVSTEMDLIGVSPKAIGRKYLIDAIILIIDGQEHNIIPTIAKKYSKSDASVERAMQNAINRTWNTADIEDLQTYYTAKITSDKAVPTLTEFIYYYANKFKLER